MHTHYRLKNIVGYKIPKQKCKLLIAKDFDSKEVDDCNANLDFVQTKEKNQTDSISDMPESAASSVSKGELKGRRYNLIAGPHEELCHLNENNGGIIKDSDIVQQTKKGETIHTALQLAKKIKPKINGKQIHVPKDYFKKMLDITDRPIRTIIKNKEDTGGFVTDHWGMHNHKRVDESVKDGIRRHFVSILRVEKFCTVENADADLKEKYENHTIEKDLPRTEKNHYISLILTAKRNCNPYKIYKLSQDDFFDLKELCSKVGSNFKNKTDHEVVKMRNIKIIIVEKVTHPL
ncbi:hypothetical protein PR048_004155 [Dryococelus australis]|uniref:Uncharacterized protein n=1 Tax=Dryococelus australis TaxID=614101 RepID=A0ABQ9I4Q3_9NEOP|nr:hypothetical protein PR048_004155 [Dryococelus australis]